jgi:hypothetical protein
VLQVRAALLLKQLMHPTQSCQVRSAAQHACLDYKAQLKDSVTMMFPEQPV